MKNQVILGVIDYMGEVATAIREEYEDCWKFVLVVGERKIYLQTY